MGDEPGVDPDAMWKPGYFAPADDARARRPGWGRSGTGMVRRLPPYEAPAAAEEQPSAGRRIWRRIDLRHRHRRRRGRRRPPTTTTGRVATAPLAGCSSPRWRWSSSASAASCGRSTDDDVRPRPPSAGVDPRTRGPGVDRRARHRSRHRHRRHAVDDRRARVGDQRSRRPGRRLGRRTLACQRRSVAQHRQPRGGRRGSDRARRGERRRPFDRRLRPRLGRTVVARGRVRPLGVRDLPGQHLPAPGRCHRCRDRAARPADRRGSQRARVAAGERGLGARLHGPRRLRRGLRPPDPRSRRGTDRHRRRGRGLGVRRSGGGSRVGTP